MTRLLTTYAIAPAHTWTGRAAFGTGLKSQVTLSGPRVGLTMLAAAGIPAADHFDRNPTPALAPRGAG